MDNITQRRAESLAKEYVNNNDMRYIVYNIRRRSYILHDFYQYFYRFSRREAVWNSPIGNIEVMTSEKEDITVIGNAITNHVNQRVEDTISLKLKKSFTEDDCMDMLTYYFNGKTYLAYYDYYLGRVVLIKERDKSIDFSELVGSRYHFIGDLHRIIKNELNIDKDQLEVMMIEIMNTKEIISEIDGITSLNAQLHEYITSEIDYLEEQITKAKEL